MSKITELAANAPQELIDEVRASHNMTVEEAAWHCVTDCVEGWVIEVDGKVAAITGVTDIEWDVGCPWLLVSSVASSKPVAFVKLTKFLLDRWAHTYSVLVNYIDTRFHQTLAWARHVGFQVDKAEPYGPFGVPFHKIVYRRK